MRVLVRADASVEIGTGHVMRCLTLAGELKKNGARVQFVSRELNGHLLEKIKEQGFPVAVLRGGSKSAVDLSHSRWLPATQQEDAEETLELTSGMHFDWLVMDHYALDFRWEEKIFPARAKQALAIDDIADRRHVADLLLDQNFYANPRERYLGKMPPAAGLLLGPEFALLRDEFSGLRARAKERSGALKEIFVFYGGADPSGQTLVALEALAQLKSELSVVVVVGPSNQRLTEVRQFCSAHSGWKILHNVEKLGQFMLKADLSLGAGGTTTWERCAMGLPALVTIIAANQEEMANAGSERGFQEVLGYAGKVKATDISRRLKEILAKPEVIRKMSGVALATVDARGAQRVVGAMRARV